MCTSKGCARRDRVIWVLIILSQIVDYVDVPIMMMYRNFLDGSNGILALTLPTIDYAKSIGKKACIWVL